jgi:hypothetical protein
MNKFGTQELLIGHSVRSANGANRANPFAWLIQPLQDRMLLPLAGLWILGLDWLLFPPEGATLAIATPVASLFGFLAGAAGVYQMQRRYAHDDRPRATLKALLAGIIVGLPFPLAGSVVGGWILASSGLAQLRDRLLRKKK